MRFKFALKNYYFEVMAQITLFYLTSNQGSNTKEGKEHLDGFSALLKIYVIVRPEEFFGDPTQTHCFIGESKISHEKFLWDERMMQQDNNSYMNGLKMNSFIVTALPMLSNSSGLMV